MKLKKINIVQASKGIKNSFKEQIIDKGDLK
jgi:hypothetical protein